MRVTGAGTLVDTTRAGSIHLDPQVADVDVDAAAAAATALHLQRAGLPLGIGMTHTCARSLVTTSAEGK